MKDKIIHNTLALFDTTGYYGTTMREIGRAVGCRMPTIYYYFKDKEALFDEAVRMNFEKLVVKLDEMIPYNLPPQETCYRWVLSRKQLTSDERLIYRLAFKVMLGFDGSDLVKKKMAEWRSTREEQYYQRFSIPDRFVVKFLISCVTQIIQRIILEDENLRDEDIAKEISLIFAGVSHVIELVTVQ